MAIKSIQGVLPSIYCYETPDVITHKGWVKIGYTEQKVDERLKEQTFTPGIRYEEKWRDLAIYTDGSNLTFTDKEFGNFLISKGINNKNNFGNNGEPIGNEWYEISAEEARKYLDEFKKKPSITKKLKNYNLRKEQRDAIDNTIIAKTENKETNTKEFLWNAKPRFGKCLSCYDFCIKTKAKKVLIVTNRPAVANSWYDDYKQYIGRDSGYFFVSHISEISKNELVIDYKQYADDCKKREEDNLPPMNLIYFVSLQDIKGSCYFGGSIMKLKEISNTHWDLLVVDESHEGVDTYKTDTAFSKITRDFTLYLSGTPFKAIRDDKFDSNEIFNWTYVSEQEAKERWNGDGTNPYMQMPRLNMLTYRLSNIIGEKEPDLTDSDEDMNDGLNEFFKTSNGKFVYESEVDKFLDIVSSQSKYPFSKENRNELNHTFWLLSRVDSVKALATKLQNHPVFKDYKIVIAAGDGKIDENDESGKSYQKVRDAIENNERTITLSVKQLTTGVTIPEWTGIMMLSERDSAAEYMQASFRAQNPYIFIRENKMTGKIEYNRKTDAYVFDFNPSHTLTIVEEFANNLYSDTVNGKGDDNERRKNIEQLLKYMPVTGESEDGNMEQLTSDEVIIIPRKLKSQEVVRRGFMCDVLFQNITNVFRINNENNGIDIISKLPVYNQPDKKVPELTITEEDIEEMHLDQDGNVNVTDDVVNKEVEKNIDKTDKEEVKQGVIETVNKIDTSIQKTNQTSIDKKKKDIMDECKKAVAGKTISKFKEKHNGNVSKQEEKEITKKIGKAIEEEINPIINDYFIDVQTNTLNIKQEFESDIQTDADKEAMEKMIQEENEKAEAKFEEDIMNVIEASVEKSFQIAEKTKIENNANQKRNEKLDEYKKRLKGFTRTIPSFLMAYGCDDFKLENIEKYIPNNVFEEVTSITLDEFKILRDDCNYFDSIIFNDAVKLFLEKRRELSHYFDEDLRQDIFDYIPPQKTNQIYTPKAVVKKMVDYLEQENPGCFDDSSATFIDLYMKSGLYITEIVKKLFNSDVIKREYPDDKKRLNHIFSKQVYGLAPTEIIYKIATRFILGFNDGENIIEKHNLKQYDALPDAQAGTLEQKLDELFKE